MTNAATKVDEQISLQDPVFNSTGYSEVELLDHMISILLIFRGPATLFSMATVIFYIPTSTQGFQCILILDNTGHFLGGFHSSHS